MKVAIASSGLGHVSRGIETWALDVANALHRRGVDVTLFAAGEVASEAPLRLLACLRRRTPLNSLVVRSMPRLTWRWGLKSDYGLEQLSFWRRLKPLLRREKFDILHVQDPLLADLCRKATQSGGLKTRVILAHGTEEPPEFLAKFDFLQHLAPWHLEQTLQKLSATATDYPGWTALPNFVDTDLFRPADNSELARLRKTHGIPPDVFVVGTAAAIKKGHKRIDYLIREFATFAATTARQGRDARLLVAGSAQPDTDELRSLAEQLCPGKILFFVDQPHARMPDLLRCLDVFVMTSIFEMMPIALLEAIATGLPPLVNNQPVLLWMGGDSSIPVDMSGPGALAEALATLGTADLARKKKAARSHAVANFSEESVIRQYIDYYDKILC